MTDQPTREELQALRDRIADLEAARDKPVKVDGQSMRCVCGERCVP